MLAFVAMAGVSEASVIPFSDTFDPADVLMDNQGGACLGDNTPLFDTVSGQIGGKCLSLTYVHVLTPPYNPATDTLLVGSLDLYLYDDTTGENANETFSFVIDLLNSPPGGITLVPDPGTSAGSPFIHNVDVLAQLQPDGSLNVTISRQAGDFMFAQSILTARGEREDQVTAPEPATLALLGLAAAASAMRRKRVL